MQAAEEAAKYYDSSDEEKEDYLVRAERRRLEKLKPKPKKVEEDPRTDEEKEHDKRVHNQLSVKEV